MRAAASGLKETMISFASLGPFQGLVVAYMGAGFGLVRFGFLVETVFFFPQRMETW